MVAHVVDGRHESALLCGRDAVALAQGEARTYGGYIYFIGGNTATQGAPAYTRDISYAKANPDGSLGSWTTIVDAMPGNRGRLTTAVANGFLYILGGQASGPTTRTNTVYYAKFDNDANGGLGAIASSGNILPTFIIGGAAYVMNGYIYYVAGDNTNPINGPDDDVLVDAVLQAALRAERGEDDRG